MNLTSLSMLQTLEALKKTIQNPTSEQSGLIADLKRQISENGRFYEVTALTVDMMREHGYDVTEGDSGIVGKIAEKVEVNDDMLWNGVDIWADNYGLKRLEDEDSRKSIVERFIRMIIPEESAIDYLEEVYENEECY